MSNFLSLFGKAFLTKKFFVWIARFAAKQSDNLVDDNLVNLTEATLDADPIAMMEHGQKLIEEATKEAKKRGLI